MKNKIVNSLLRPQIDDMIRMGMKTTEIALWCGENGLDISQQAISNYKNRIESAAVGEIRKVAQEIAEEKLDLTETAETGIKALKKVLLNSDLGGMRCRNPRDVAVISQAMANLTRADLEVRSVMPPKKNLKIIELIKKCNPNYDVVERDA